jgi:hypothetical protein
MPHFALVTTDGTALGVRELGRPDWPPGRVPFPLFLAALVKDRPPPV